jgi:hypothetical protein
MQNYGLSGFARIHFQLIVSRCFSWFITSSSPFKHPFFGYQHPPILGPRYPFNAANFRGHLARSARARCMAAEWGPLGDGSQVFRLEMCGDVFMVGTLW